VPGGDHRGRHYEDIYLARTDEFSGVESGDGRRRYGDLSALLMEFGDAAEDEFVFDGLLVGRLGDDDSVLGGGGGDSLEYRGRVFVATQEALQVKDANSAKLGENRRGVGIDDRVHGRGEDGEFEADAGEFATEVHVLGIEGRCAGHQSDVIEAEGLSSFSSATDRYLHASNILP